MIYIPGLQVQAQDDSILDCHTIFGCLDSRGYALPAKVTGTDLTATGITGADIRMWIYPTAQPRTVPLYKYVNQYDIPSPYWFSYDPIDRSPVHVHKFYYDTRVLDLRNAGYKLIGVAGYIFPLNTPEAARPGTVPLQEFYNPTTGVHAYTTLPFTGRSHPGPDFTPTREVGYVFDDPRDRKTMLFREYSLAHVYSLWGVAVPWMLYTHFYSIYPTEVYQFIEHFEPCDPEGFFGCPFESSFESWRR